MCAGWKYGDYFTKGGVPSLERLPKTADALSSEREKLE